MLLCPPLTPVLLGLKTSVGKDRLGLYQTTEQSLLAAPARRRKGCMLLDLTEYFLNGSREHPAMSLPAPSLRVGIFAAVLCSSVSESLSSQTPFFSPMLRLLLLRIHPHLPPLLWVRASSPQHATPFLYNCHREGEQVTALMWS